MMLGEVPAVLVGQHQVEHHQVGALAADDVQSGAADYRKFCLAIHLNKSQ